MKELCISIAPARELRSSPERPPIPSLADVAREANVSRTTASRALRNHPSLPAETCGRIQRIAERIGYHRDAIVSSMMAGLRWRKSRGVRDSIAVIFGTKKVWNMVSSITMPVSRFT